MLSFEGKSFKLFYDEGYDHLVVKAFGRRLVLARQAAVSTTDSVDAGVIWRFDGEERGAESAVWKFSAASSVWEERHLTLEATPDGIIFNVRVRGKGRVGKVNFFSGYPGSVVSAPDATMGRLKWARRDCSRSWTGSPQLQMDVFNPQPNAACEQTLPPACQQRITCATTFGPDVFNTFFAPCVYAYIFGDTFSVGVAAPRGQNTYNHFDYRIANGWGLELNYDGMASVDGEWTSPAIRIAPCASWDDGLKDYCAYLVRKGLAPAPSANAPEWARLPMFCGWGQQTVWATLASQGNKLPVCSPVTEGAGGFANQDAYTEMAKMLDKVRLPYGTLTIDMGWSAANSIPEPDSRLWPDLKGFIAGLHAKGKKVFLWLSTWNTRGLPQECLMPHDSGLPDVVDPSSPVFRKRLVDAIERAVSPSGFDADGFKIDFTGDAPRGPGYRPQGGAWGLELTRDYVELIHSAMKAAKPGSVLETHCANPHFVDITEMIRLNDIFSYGADIRKPMAFRSQIARIVNPDWVIDTDNDPFISRDAWRNYMLYQPSIGIPCLYTLTHMSFNADNADPEEIRMEDLSEVRAIWEDYTRRIEAAAKP